MGGGGIGRVAGGLGPIFVKSIVKREGRGAEVRDRGSEDKWKRGRWKGGRAGTRPARTEGWKPPLAPTFNNLGIGSMDDWMGGWAEEVSVHQEGGRMRRK